MSATELLEQVEALPPTEQASFAHLFHLLEAETSTAATQHQQWPDFAARLDRIYGEKVLPDSQVLIAEGRGER